MQDEYIRIDIVDIDYDISVFRQSLESRFPDLQFVLQNLIFLNPENRRHSKCNIEAVIQRFCKERIQSSTAKM